MVEKIRSNLPQRALEYFAEIDETLYVQRLGVTDYAPFLGFGASAEILSPDWLRAQVGEQIARAAALYGESRDSKPRS